MHTCSFLPFFLIVYLLQSQSLVDLTLQRRPGGDSFKRAARTGDIIIIVKAVTKSFNSGGIMKGRRAIHGLDNHRA